MNQIARLGAVDFSACLTFHISSAAPAAEHLPCKYSDQVADLLVSAKSICHELYLHILLNNEMTNKHLFPEMGDFKGGFDMPPPPYSEVGQVGNIIC